MQGYLQCVHVILYGTQLKEINIKFISPLQTIKHSKEPTAHT